MIFCHWLYLRSLSSIIPNVSSVFKEILKRNLKYVWRLKELKNLRQNEIFVVNCFIKSLVCR